MTKKTTVVSIFTIDWEKLKRIKISKEFPNYAETVGYVLWKFPEMIPEIKEPGSASPIIDADNLRIVTPSTLADKLARDALKATSTAIRKAYPLEESKE